MARRAGDRAINDRLQIAAGKPPAGTVRAKARIRRRRFSVVEREPAADRGTAPATLEAFLAAWGPRLGPRGREQLFALVQPAVLDSSAPPVGRHSRAA